MSFPYSPTSSFIGTLILTLSYIIFINRYNENEETNCCEVYEGSCHCGGVHFKVLAPKTLCVWVCDCSICDMKKNWHFVVPESNFKLLSAQDNLIEYQFNSKVARHLFCKVCGVQSFYRPRSNPNGVAVTYACLKNYKVTNELYFMKLFSEYLNY